ncbi:MAG TPA: hypothetical protein VGG33_20495 [Polyangia bacterium]
MKSAESLLGRLPRLSQSTALRMGVTCAAFHTAGCATVHMATPTDVVQTSEEIPVTDRSSASGALVDESFKMGAYQVVNVDRKSDSSRGFSIAGISAGSTRGGYGYAVKSAAAEHKGQCATQNEQQAARLLGGSLEQARANVVCECAGPSAASLFIGADSVAGYRGTVRLGGGNYTLTPIFESQQGSTHGTPLGYDVRGVIPAGAVEVSGKGRIWLNRTLGPDAKADLACLFAGLLLYKPPAP